MCPPGGVHIRHKLASKAARVLQVDYADAVTGFNFKGRHGTAVIQGVVVAEEYGEAVHATIEGMEYMQEQAEMDARRAESLRLWRRFYLGLRIAQRVNAIEIEGQRGDVIDVQASINYEEQRRQADEMAGGFLPEDTAYVEPPRPPKPDIDFGGGFVPDNDDHAGAEDDGHNQEGGGGGGFLPNQDSDLDLDLDLAGPSLNRQESFGSVILESQELRPRRPSSAGAPYVSSAVSSPRHKRASNASDDDEEEEDEDEESEWEDPAAFDCLDLPDRAAAQPDSADTGGGFFLPPTATDADADAAMHDALAPSEEALSHKPEAHAVPHVHTVEPEVPVVSTEEERQQQQQQQQQEMEMETEPPVPSLLSEISDAGSLPLEDPEDEDAEPDWLVDAT
jgi:xeroderma pigmentosum group C-complementing protein